jgi:hypothetical protein
MGVMRCAYEVAQILIYQCTGSVKFVSVLVNTHAVERFTHRTAMWLRTGLRLRWRWVPVLVNWYMMSIS